MLDFSVRVIWASLSVLNWRKSWLYHLSAEVCAKLHLLTISCYFFIKWMEHYVQIGHMGNIFSVTCYLFFWDEEVELMLGNPVVNWCFLRCWTVVYCWSIGCSKSTELTIQPYTILVNLYACTVQLLDVPKYMVYFGF